MPAAFDPSLLDRVAAAPISWGICEAPGWGLQLPVDRVLSEAQSLGITAFEQGAIGWLPTDPDEQRATLAAYGMSLVGGFVPLVLHDPALRDRTLAAADRISAAMAAAGGHHFVTCAVPDLDNWYHLELDDDGWSELLSNLTAVDRIVAAHGLLQVVHPHVDSIIETDDDFRRFLDACGVAVCLDTGHLTIGGADAVDVVRTHVDRIGLIHLKDVDPGVAERERSGELNLMEATQAGLFPSLGDGSVPIADVIRSAEELGYTGWYVMETDVALTDGEPPIGEGPALGVARSLQFLRSLELAGVS